MGQTLADALGEALVELPVYDTHEHIYHGESHFTDVMEYFVDYTATDLASAGMRDEEWERVGDRQRPLADRWSMLEPYWARVRHTGYGRAIREAFRECFGVDRVDLSGIREVQARLADAARHPSEDILRQRGYIVGGVLCTNEFPPLFHDAGPEWQIAPKIDYLLEIVSLDHLDQLTEWFGFGQPVREYRLLLEFLEHALDRLADLGMTVVKTGQAYRRPLDYRLHQDQEAQHTFNRLLTCGELDLMETIPLQDRLLELVLRWVEKRGLPLQVHTGIQAGAARIANTRAGLMQDLILAHPEVTFCMFHGSFPYWRELGAMAKNYPNVYIDMCWLHAISPESSQTALNEWLGLMASNKILGFGGDYRFFREPELCVGHLALARRDIAQVLARRIEAGWLTEDEALDLAGALLFDNARSVYALSTP